MRHFVRKHKYKFIAAPGLLAVAFFLTTSFLAGEKAILFFSSKSPLVLEVGEQAEITVHINAYIPINSVDVSIAFPADKVEILSVSKNESFINLWVEEPAIDSNKGIVSFVGGSTKIEGHMGTGTLLTLIVRGKTPGSAHMTFESAAVYPHDGSGQALQIRSHSLDYVVATSSIPSGSGIKNQPIAGSSASGARADLNSDGSVTLVDVSILMFSMMSEYNGHHDLNSDGAVSLTDLSILLSYF